MMSIHTTVSVFQLNFSFMCDNIHRLPVFLTKMLQMVENGDKSIVRWDSSGRTVIIESVSKFADEVLPKYFKMKKFTSFVRQLNLYGFRKISSEMDPNQCEFFHSCFRQGKTELLERIVRRTKVRETTNLKKNTNEVNVEELNETINSLRSELEEQRNKYQELLSEYNKLKENNSSSLPSPQSQCLPTPLIQSSTFPPCLISRISSNDNDNNIFDCLSPLISDKINYSVNFNQNV